MFINNQDESEGIMDICTTDFGGSLQPGTQLSTAWLAIVNTPNDNKVIEISSYYKLSLSVLEDTMNLRKTKKQII